jgi:RNA polymerase sigma-70 factor (ECF subfamily)
MQLPPENGISAADSPFTTTPDAEWRVAFDQARTHWPSLDVSFEDFSKHLARLGYERDLPPQLGSVYLCLACAQGCPSACRLLDARYFPALRAFLSKFDSRADVIDDLLQQIRYRLLVGLTPRIRSYRGQGSFEGWLRKVAATIAVDSIRVHIGRERLLHRLGQDKVCSDQTYATPPLPPDEQLHHERHARMVQRALNQSIQTLPSDRRQLLHHYYVDGLSIDQLGAMYGCNRSTAARRVVHGVQMIQRSLRKELARELGALGGELEAWVPVLYRSWGVDVAGWLGG